MSQRDPTQAHAALKRAQDNTARFRRKREEEEARQKAQQESLARMQRLAEQHEAYNPNLSMGGRGHDDARKGKPLPKSDDVTTASGIDAAQVRQCAAPARRTVHLKQQQRQHTETQPQSAVLHEFLSFLRLARRPS